MSVMADAPTLGYQSFTPDAGRTYDCTGEEFCCFLSGEPCEYSVQNQAGRRYACGLYIKYGSWAAVNASPEYQPIGAHWDAINNPDIPFNYCETFDPAFCCRPEFRNGRHNESCEPGCEEVA